MSNPGKPKAVFTYCLQIWMTGIVLGPMLYLFWQFKQFTDFADWLGFGVGIGLYSILFSIPGMLLFSGAAVFVFFRPWPVNMKRLTLGIWGVFLTIAVFKILFNKPLSTRIDMYPGSVCYLIPSFLSVWIYRWPGRIK